MATSDHTPDTDDLLDERAAAARIRGIAPATLRAWRSEGRGPAYHRRGGRIYYTARDLDAWLAAQRIEPTTSSTRGAIQ